MAILLIQSSCSRKEGIFYYILSLFAFYTIFTIEGATKFAMIWANLIKAYNNEVVVVKQVRNKVVFTRLIYPIIYEGYPLSGVIQCSFFGPIIVSWYRGSMS